MTLSNKRIVLIGLAEDDGKNEFQYDEEDVKEAVKRYIDRLRKLGVKTNEIPAIIGVELAILELKRAFGKDLI